MPCLLSCSKEFRNKLQIMHFMLHWTCQAQGAPKPSTYSDTFKNMPIPEIHTHEKQCPFTFTACLMRKKCNFWTDYTLTVHFAAAQDAHSKYLNSETSSDYCPIHSDSPIQNQDAQSNSIICSTSGLPVAILEILFLIVIWIISNYFICWPWCWWTMVMIMMVTMTNHDDDEWIITCSACQCQWC